MGIEQITMNENWKGASIDMNKVNAHPNFLAGEVVGYQGVRSIFAPHEVAWYHCILKDKRNSANPYHIGTISLDYSVAAYDCAGREYQLSWGGYWWFQVKPPEESPRYVQWMDWVWKNEDEERLFQKWYDRKFSQKPNAQQSEKSDVISEDPDQMTLF